jgi:hypothetical protein
MELGPADFGVVSSDSAKSAGEGGVAAASALDGESLSHHRAAASKDLKVGHGAAAGRSIVGRSRSGQATQGGRRRFFEERAHAPGLAEKGFHCLFNGQSTQVAKELSIESEIAERSSKSFVDCSWSE